MNRAVSRAALLALALLSSTPVAHAQHAPPNGPAQMRVEFENVQLLVLRIRLGAREKTPMHDLSPRFVIWLTDAHIRDTKPDGSASEFHRDAGATEWVPAQRHAGENLADVPVEFLAVVPKGTPTQMRH